MHDRTTWADVWRRWRPQKLGRPAAVAAAGVVLLSTTTVVAAETAGETARSDAATVAAAERTALASEHAARAGELTAQIDRLETSLRDGTQALEEEQERRRDAERELAALRREATAMQRELNALERELQLFALPESGQDDPDVAPPSADDDPAPDARSLPLDRLRVTDFSDGDSFTASDGSEYRLGLVNAPERGEPCADEATTFTRDFLGDGFTADVYATDRYGRLVAEVFNNQQQSLNEALAASGLGDDRYLADFRHENPDLAGRLDERFATAATPACRVPEPAPAPAPEPAPAPAPGNDCHAAYDPCVPIKGDGSGNGNANDLDCGDIRRRVRVVDPGHDPYRFDADGDGWGCESYG